MKYKISAKRFGKYYDFYNSEQLVDDFLNNVRTKFRPSDLVLVKCRFIIENIQQALSENVRPILNNGTGLQKHIERHTLMSDIL